MLFHAGRCHNPLFLVGLRDDLEQLVSRLYFWVVADNRHACQLSECHNWSTSVKIGVVHIELGVGFLNKRLPPCTVIGNICIEWSFDLVIGVEWILSFTDWKSVINNNLDWPRHMIECKLEDTCLVVWLIGKDLFDSWSILSESGAWCEEPTVT